MIGRIRFKSLEPQDLNGIEWRHCVRLRFTRSRAGRMIELFAQTGTGGRLKAESLWLAR